LDCAAVVRKIVVKTKNKTSTGTFWTPCIVFEQHIFKKFEKSIFFLDFFASIFEIPPFLDLKNTMQSALEQGSA
jgi:hypothetical protein